MNVLSRGGFSRNARNRAFGLVSDTLLLAEARAESLTSRRSNAACFSANSSPLESAATSANPSRNSLFFIYIPISRAALYQSLSKPSGYSELSAARQIDPNQTISQLRTSL